MTKILKILFKAPPYAYTLVIGLAICYLTLAPHPLPSNSFKLFPHFDKVAHFVMFAALSGAFLFDMSRAKGFSPTFGRTTVAVCLSIIAGGVIEWLQQLMNMGRSSDLLDFIADSIGAVCGALIVKSLLKKMNDEDFRVAGKITLSPYNISIKGLDDVREIYLSSFPEEERRPWDDILRLTTIVGGPYALYIIMCGYKPVGLLSTWTFDEFVYVEHFAVNESHRGNGIGKTVVRELLSSVSRPVVLEVELPEAGEDARRRIDFYVRNGFTPLADYCYVQPPYQSNLPEVNLMLMSTDPKINAEKVASTLHRDVYGVLS